MTITNSSLRLVALVTGVAVAIALMGAVAVAPAQAAGLTQTQIQSITSLLASFGADAATIANVTAALNGQATPGTGSGTGGTCPALTRDLQQGSSGADVKALQVFLNGSASTQLAVTGAGSPGNESTYFGPITKAAVMKFQSANNVSPVAGYVGPITRAAIAAVCGGSNPNPNPGPTTGGAVSVSAGAQPVNSLAVSGASRVPFTTFTLSNNSSQAVTINSVTIQRTGLGTDDNFSGVVLLDSNGLQIGNSKTFNSNHQTNIGDTGFTLAAGASMNFTVAGNMAASTVVHSGQVVSLQVVAINTGATVSGSLPISGASQTINNTLTLGSFSTSTSSVIPKTGTSHTQNVGDTSVRFSGLKFTASSAEDLKLFSVRWRQIGSASSVDISNVTTVVEGTTYPTTVDSTGKYYTTVFPGGILIPKGNSIDIYAQGDLLGSNSASRTVQFTIDRATDVYFVGQIYGYGVADTVFPNAQPWYQGDSFTIQAGTASTISKSNATADAAQNIAVNVNGQPFGGFVTNFLGEPVSVTGMTFAVGSSTGAGLLTTVSVTDDNGSVVAGPVDGTVQGTSLVFSDTVTFPTGLHTYHVKGKVGSTAPNGKTVTLTVTPTNWTNPTGQVTGNSITISNGAFALNQMTVRGATTTITMSSSPIGQNIVAGVQGFTFANVQLDASQSGENVRMSSLPLTLSGTNAGTDLSSCQIFDGSTALTTGSRVQTTVSAGTVTFSFDNAFVIPKGTVKTLSVVCNLSSNSAGSDSVIWTLLGGASYSASGVTSGVSITPSVASLGASGTMTVANGSATVAVDASSPGYKLVAAGSTGVTNTVLKFHATNETLNLTDIGLSLTNSGNTLSGGAAGNGGTHRGADDIVQAYIYNGGTLVGTAAFTGGGITATSTLSTPVTLTKDADTLLTVKLDLASIGVSSNGGIGDILRVDPLNFKATGASSGVTVSGPTATSTVTTGTAGVQMVKSYPTITNAGVSCTNTTSCNGTAQVLKKFSITANGAGPVGLYQVAVSLATSSAKVANLKLFAYTDSGYSTPANVPGTSAGQFGGTAPLNGTGGETAAPTVSFLTNGYSSAAPLQIPAGSTYYFSVIGDVSVGSATGWSVNTTVLGDSATSTTIAGYNATTTVNVSGNETQYVNGVSTSTPIKNFYWSDNATTTAAANDIDWFDGYFVPGLSSSGF